ncbi:MAG: hypothetical protein ACRDHO_01415 [Actinomycetota bacterium]
MEIEQEKPGVYPRALAVINANGDGRAEALVRLGGGADNDQLTMVIVTDSRIGEVRVKGGDPFHFRVGGSFLVGSGAECSNQPGRAPRFLVLSASSEDGKRFTWTERSFVWNGTEVVPQGGRKGVLTYQGDDDPRLHRFWRLKCGDVVIG